MKVSKVDQILPFVNQEEIDTTVRRLQNLDGAIRRAVELYRGYSFAGNVKKAEYFSHIAATRDATTMVSSDTRLPSASTTSPFRHKT